MTPGPQDNRADEMPMTDERKLRQIFMELIGEGSIYRLLVDSGLIW